MAGPVLEARNLVKHFPVKRGIFSRQVAVVRAVDDISFSIDPGKTLGLVGESAGGQRERIATGRALPLSRKVGVPAEPVSALDVSIRAQILNLLRDLQAQLGVSYLFIAHDLAAVSHMSHAIAVMYLGKIVEVGDAEIVSKAPKHPYTQALFSAALPSHPDDRRDDEIILTGEVPRPLDPPGGCRFHPRCPYALPRCSSEEPKLLPESGRLVACHLYPK